MCFLSVYTTFLAMPRREATNMRWQMGLRGVESPSRLDAYGCAVALHEAEIDREDSIQDAHV